MATWKIKGRDGVAEYSRQLKIVSSALGGLLLQSAYPHQTRAAVENEPGANYGGDSCAFGDGVAELSLAPYELNRLRGALGLGQVEFIDETGLDVRAQLTIDRGEDGAPRFVIRMRQADADDQPPAYIDEPESLTEVPRSGLTAAAAQRLERKAPPGGATIGPLFGADSADANRPAKPAAKRGRPRGKRGRPKSIRPPAA